MVVGYGPNEGDGEEKDNIGNGYRLCILGDLNEWIRDWTRAGLPGAFRVLGDMIMVEE